MFGLSFKPKLAPNESPVTIYWENGQEDQTTLLYESGIYFNHALGIAVTESDSIAVDIYSFPSADTPPIHQSEELELRTDPTPLEHSETLWDALKTQNEITSAGNARRSAVSNAKSNQWTQIKIWTFLIGIALFSIITLWSLKIGSDAIDIIDEQIEQAYEESRRIP